MCKSHSRGRDGHAHGQHHHHHHNHHHGEGVSRRDALKVVGAAAAAFNFGGIVRAVDDVHPPGFAPAGSKLFDLKKVTEGVYAAIAQPTAMLNCNAAVIVNRDHVLVVDTHSKPSAAKALLRQIKDEITPLPVRYVVDSHLHGDHAMGNEAYPDAFGGNVELISSTKTREWLEKLGMPRLKESLDGIPKQIAEFKGRLADAKTEEAKAAIQTFIEGLEAYVKEMTPPRVVLPTVTFDREMIIHRGGRDIHLKFLGRAHTAGDVVAYIPSERVVATGDLMHGLLPYMGDGYPDEWVATLKSLEALEFDRVLPGHGSIQDGKLVLAEFRGYIEEINEKVSRGVERGQTLDELSKTILPDGMKSLGAGTRRRLEREYGSLFAMSKPAEMVNGSVASNVKEVYTYLTERKGKNEIPKK